MFCLTLQTIIIAQMLSTEGSETETAKSLRWKYDITPITNIHRCTEIFVEEVKSKKGETHGNNGDDDDDR